MEKRIESQYTTYIGKPSQPTRAYSQLTTSELELHVTHVILTTCVTCNSNSEPNEVFEPVSLLTFSVLNKVLP